MTLRINSPKPFPTQIVDASETVRNLTTGPSADCIGPGGIEDEEAEGLNRSDGLLPSGVAVLGISEWVCKLANVA